MPNTLFLIGSGLTFFVWWILRKSNEALDDNNNIISENDADVKKSDNDTDQNNISLSEIADNSAISMQLGYGLIQLVDDENDGSGFFEKLFLSREDAIICIQRIDNGSLRQ